MKNLLARLLVLVVIASVLISAVDEAVGFLVAMIGIGVVWDAIFDICEKHWRKPSQPEPKSDPR